MATEPIRIVVSERGAKKTSNAIRGVGKSAKGAESSVSLLSRALGALAVAAVTRSILQTADAFTLMQNRIRLVTKDTAQLNVVTEELVRIANSTRSNLDNTANAYFKVARQAGTLGLTQREVLNFTESLNQAIVLSGASAVEASSGILQLGQGLASGALRGDELRSVLENLPEVAQTIADGMGVTIGQLRLLGAEGKISADAVIDAFEKASDSLAKRFGTTVPTIGQAVQVLRNQWLVFVGELDQSSGVTAFLAQGLLTVAENFDTLGKSAGVAAVAIGTILAGVAIPAAIAGLKSLALVIAANPFGALAVAVTTATAALVIFGDEITVTEDGMVNMRDVALAVWNNIAAATSNLAKQVGGFFSRMAESAGNTFGFMLESWDAVPRFMAKGLDFIGQMVVGTGLAIFEVSKQLVKNLRSVGSQLIEFVTSGFDESVFRNQGEKIGVTFTEAVLRGFQSAGLGETGIFESQLNGVVTAVEGVVDGIIADARVIAADRIKREQAERVSREDALASLNDVVQGVKATLDEGPPTTFLEGYLRQLEEMQEATEHSTAIFGGQLAEIFGPGGMLSQGFGNIIAQTIVFGDRVDQLFKRLGQSILTNVISNLVQMGINMALNAALGKSLTASTTATSVASGAAVAAAWQPAATFVNAATFGAGAAAGQTALTTSLAATKAFGLAGGGVPGFESGGFTGGGAPGQPVGVVHPNEFVMSAEATRRLGVGNLSAMNSGGAPKAARMNVTVINNAGSDVMITPRQISDTDVELIAERVLVSKGPEVIARDLDNPGGKTRRAVTRGTSARNRRI